MAHKKAKKIIIRRNVQVDQYIVIISIVILAIIGVAFVQVTQRITRTEQEIGSADTDLKIGNFDAAQKEYIQANHVLPLFGSLLSKRLDQVAQDKQGYTFYTQGLQNLDNNNIQIANALFQKVSSNSTFYTQSQNMLSNTKSIPDQEERIKEQIHSFLMLSQNDVQNHNYVDAQLYAKLAAGYLLSSLTIQADKTLAINVNNNIVSVKNAINLSQQTPTPPKSIPHTLLSLRVPILMYHYIRVNPIATDKLGYSLSVTPSDFQDQMQYLVNNNYTTITITDLLDALKGKMKLPSKPIILTFDDGYSDFYENAYPVLQQYHLKAETYVITNYIDHIHYMTWGMLQEMLQSNLITIGSHTLNHPDLKAISPDQAEREIIESKKVIENTLHTSVTDFCYPYGSYNQYDEQVVEKAGYKDATTTAFNAVHTNADDLFSIPRVRVSGGESLQNFANNL